MSPSVSPSTIFLGLYVHKESITIAVLPTDASAPTRVDKLPYDLRKLRRYLERLGPSVSLRACYEASGAGYVLQRALTQWEIACTVVAPSLIPMKPGVQRKHDKYDASQLARLFRAGELTAVHIPTEAEERVRDVVRCRTTFQREILKSRHYILKFLARRGYVYREGTNWRQPGSADRSACAHSATRVARGTTAVLSRNRHACGDGARDGARRLASL